MLGLVRQHYANFGPTQACMETLREYLTRHGWPVALYSGKHSIFLVNCPNREGELTRFSRALGTLDPIFSLHAHRKLSKNLTLQYKNREYPLTGLGKGYRLRAAQVNVCEAFDGAVTLLCKGQVLPYRILNEGDAPFALSR